MDRFSVRNEFQILNNTQDCPQTTRSRLWQAFAKQYVLRMHTHGNNPHYDIVEDILAYFGLEYAYNQLHSDHNENANKLRDYICKEAEWYKVYDFVEYVLSYGTNQNGLKMAFDKILEDEHTQYRIINGVVAPITNEAEIATIENAIEESPEHIAESIRKSLKLFSDFQSPDYNNAIKESITAVESLCCTIVNGEKNTLGKALNKLSDHGISLNENLKEAIQRLYNYTNSEEGVRHGGTTFIPADSDDAKFMIVSCSAIINYLIAKWNKVKETNYAD